MHMYVWCPLYIIMVYSVHQCLSMQPHDVSSEHPVTYWTQNQDRVMGTTQVRLGAAPFAKNAAFSTPIQHYQDQPLPHDLPF